MFNLFKNLIIMLVVVLALVGFGEITNELIPWVWLVYFFGIIRNLSSLFDFFWDTDTLFVLVGISFYIEMTYWTIRAILAIIKGTGFVKN